MKKWQETTPLSNYIVATKTYANAHHGSVILIKNNIVIKRVDPVEKENNYPWKTLEILKLCITLPFFGDFWIVSVYNSPGKPLSLEKVFSERMSNVFVCGDFNSPRQELNCSYDSENGEKLLNLIKEGQFKLLNNGHYTYQSVDGKSRNMLDLHFCDSTVFTTFNNFEVTEALGSDHRTTITTLNLKISKMFELKSKIDLRMFKENTRKSYRSSILWPAQYPGKDDLNQFSSSLVELIHKSLEDSYVIKNKFPYSIETQKLIKLKRRKRRQLKSAFAVDFRSLRTEINYLQKEIKRSIRQSEERKRAKILERASDKGSKGFWRAIKELTNDHESKLKNGDYPNLNYKESQAVRDQEKSELFKQLLKDTMKDHTPVSSGIAEHCEKIENQTKPILGTVVDIEHLCVVITTKEFDEILRESSHAQVLIKSATNYSESY